jgi:hypothetical protein
VAIACLTKQLTQIMDITDNKFSVKDKTICQILMVQYPHFSILATNKSELADHFLRNKHCKILQYMIHDTLTSNTLCALVLGYPADCLRVDCKLVFMKFGL